MGPSASEAARPGRARRRWVEGGSVAKCWRCGGGKTITVTTTGTHVLPCPTCGGLGESPRARGGERNEAAALQHPQVGPLATATPSAADPLRAGAKVA